MICSGVVGVVSAAGWFCIFVLMHVLGLRSGRANAGWLIRSYVIAVIASLATALGLTGTSGTVQSCLLMLSTLVFTSACLFVLYVPAVYVILTSLSMQTLIVLRERGGECSTETLYDRFGGRAIVADRLATLAASHYLREQGGVFYLTGRGRYVSKIFGLVKRIWKLAPGG
jgi:hypothetical protein